ncbi:MAG: DNA polymerase III subunit gamma/tau, partial [Paracoccus sp. (in: a-proteobacteria)]|nr:DNA polymerase III subunit gamma/tau [Paracoccus sp. (in: a-proteobacteria)]
SAAPNAMMAAEMAVIRMTHVADLPDPESLIRKVQQAQQAGEFTRAPSAGARAPAPGPQAHAVVQPSGQAVALALCPDALAAFPDFASVVELIRRMRDMTLLVQVENHLALVRYAPGRIEFEPRDGAPADLAQRLAERLRGWTGGQRWGVSVVSSGGGPTIAETRAAAARQAEAEAMQNPLVQAVFAAFPDARITRIATPPAVESAADPAVSGHETTDGVIAEVADEWDPFEDEV